MRNTQAHWGLFFTAGQRIEFARRFSATTQSAMRAIALSLALAVLPLSANAARAQEAGIPVGSTGPNVTLETLDGGTVELSQWVGKKPVLLEFWASWCPNCKALEPAMEAAHAEFGDRVEFIGIAVSVNQPVDRVRRYIERYKLPMTMLYDRRGDASAAYDAPATSYVVVLDASGKVVYTGTGAKQDISAAVRRALN